MHDFETKLYKASEDLLIEKIGDEAVVVSVSDAMIMSLNESGAVILEALALKPHTYNDIIQLIIDIFEVDRETAKSDVAHFLVVMIDNKLVTMS